MPRIPSAVSSKIMDWEATDLKILNSWVIVPPALPIMSMAASMTFCGVVAGYEKTTAFWAIFRPDASEASAVSAKAPQYGTPAYRETAKKASARPPEG